MLSIQVTRFHRAEEELAAVGVWACIGHRQNSGARVFKVEVLILKLLAIDGLAPRSIASGEVTTLAHELRDDSMEFGTFEPKSLLPGAKCPEVFRSFGNLVSLQFHFDSANRLVICFDVHPAHRIAGVGVTQGRLIGFIDFGIDRQLG